MLTSRDAGLVGDYQPPAITPVSRRDALRYATAVSALAGLGAASTSAATPAAAAAAPTLIDFAMRQIPAQDIRAAGHSGVINYVSLSRPGSSFGAKPITRPYAESLTAAGLAIVSNYQYGKPGGTAPSDFTRGFAGGVADARTAWQLHTAAGGGQSAPIFFTVDDDINRDTWNTVALQWFRGINSVLGVQRTGIYGGINVCQWAASRWRYREFAHGRPPVGLADPVLVSRSGRPRRSSLPARGEHRVESRPGGRRDRSRRQRRPGPGLRPVEPTSVRS